MNKFITMLALLAFGLAACNKTDFDTTVTGEALGNFRLSSPSTGASVMLNAATPNQSIEITWTAARPGVRRAPTYTWVAAPRSGGNLDAPLVSVPSNNNGADTKLTVTQKALDDLLKARNIADGARADLIWSVVADNGDTKVRSQDVFNISVTRMRDGATPFTLLAPATSAVPVAIDPGNTTSNLTFRWTRSMPATGGPAISYRILFSLDSNFANPLFTLRSNNNGVDTFANISFKALSDTLTAKGQTNLSQPSDLKWVVVATSGTFSQQSNVLNRVVILREVRMYMPGSYQASQGQGTNWTPADAPELIRDLRAGATNSVYYTYVFLPAGAQFKITEGRAWSVAYGTVGGSTNTNGEGDATTNGGNDFSIANAGVYRISINRSTGKYDIRPGRMGFVGGAVTSVGWNPPNVFPTSAMAYVGRDRFLGVYDFTADGWKFIDNNSWNSSGVNISDTRSYGSAGPTGSELEVNGANMPNITTAGRYRFIWDGTNVNKVIYEQSSASIMRIVGDGIDTANFQNWNPPTSPQMNYIGNGRWQRTIRLLPNKDIKFLAGSAWGEFDYEDDSNQSNTVGTPRRIRYNGNNNFKTPAIGGVYTITLDEMAQTVTIQ